MTALKKLKTPPRARVKLEFTGWKVYVDGRPYAVGHVGWTWRTAMDYANSAVASARREWYARGCTKCRGRGFVPDWGSWDAYHGEPKPKPCPDCQPKEKTDA